VTAAVAVGGAVGAVVDASGRSATAVVTAVSTPSPHRTPSAPHASHIAGSGLPNTSSTAIPGATRRPTHRPTPTPLPTP
jgi:hypothetical protein